MYFYYWLPRNSSRRGRRSHKSFTLENDGFSATKNKQQTAETIVRIKNFCVLFTWGKLKNYLLGIFVFKKDIFNQIKSVINVLVDGSDNKTGYCGKRVN